MSRMLIYDELGQRAGVEIGGRIFPAANPAGVKLNEWITDGVPGVMGKDTGTMIVEVPIIRRPADPLFGLALLEYFEDIGWTVRKEVSGRLRPSALQTRAKRLAMYGVKSYFSECPRDEHGHCLPKGQAAHIKHPKPVKAPRAGKAKPTTFMDLYEQWGDDIQFTKKNKDSFYVLPDEGSALATELEEAGFESWGEDLGYLVTNEDMEQLVELIEKTHGLSGGDAKEYEKKYAEVSDAIQKAADLEDLEEYWGDGTGPDATSQFHELPQALQDKLTAQYELKKQQFQEKIKPAGKKPKEAHDWTTWVAKQGKIYAQYAAAGDFTGLQKLHTENMQYMTDHGATDYGDLPTLYSDQFPDVNPGALDEDESDDDENEEFAGGDPATSSAALAIDAVIGDMETQAKKGNIEATGEIYETHKAALEKAGYKEGIGELTNAFEQLTAELHGAPDDNSGEPDHPEEVTDKTVQDMGAAIAAKYGWDPTNIDGATAIKAVFDLQTAMSENEADEIYEQAIIDLPAGGGYLGAVNAEWKQAKKKHGGGYNIDKVINKLPEEWKQWFSSAVADYQHSYDELGHLGTVDILHDANIEKLAKEGAPSEVISALKGAYSDIYKQHQAAGPANAYVAPMPKNSYVDTSLWPHTDPSAKFAATQLAALDILEKGGYWENIQNKYNELANHPSVAHSDYLTQAVQAYAQAMTLHGIEQKPIQAKTLSPAPLPPTPAPSAVADVTKDPATMGGKTVTAPQLAIDKQWQQVGGQLGGNPGGKFLDPHGKAFYVKYSKSPAHAQNEVLAAKLYELAGCGVPEYHLVQSENGVGTASAWIDSAKLPDYSNPLDKEAATAAFATHAWLANWDAIGGLGSYNNQNWITKPDGSKQLITIDTGGSMGYSALGKKKKFDDSVDEFGNFLDSSVNAEFNHVFKNMTPQQLLASCQKVAALTDDNIKALVDQYGPGDAKDKKELYETLLARRAAVAAKVEQIKQSLITGDAIEKPQAAPAPTPASEPKPALNPAAAVVVPELPTPIGTKFPAKPQMQMAANVQMVADLEQAAMMSPAALQMFINDNAKKINQYPDLKNYADGLTAAIAPAAPKPAAPVSPLPPKPNPDDHTTSIANKINALEAYAKAGAVDEIEKMDGLAGGTVDKYKQALLAFFAQDHGMPPVPSKHGDLYHNVYWHMQNLAKVGNLQALKNSKVSDPDLSAYQQKLIQHLEAAKPATTAGPGLIKLHNNLVTLPHELKDKYPGIKVHVYPASKQFAVYAPLGSAAYSALKKQGFADKITPGEFMFASVDLPKVDQALSKEAVEPDFGAPTSEPGKWKMPVTHIAVPPSKPTGLVQLSDLDANTPGELAAKYAGLQLNDNETQKFFTITAPPGSPVAMAFQANGYVSTIGDENKYAFYYPHVPKLDSLLGKLVKGAGGSGPAPSGSLTEAIDQLANKFAASHPGLIEKLHGSHQFAVHAEPGTPAHEALVGGGHKPSMNGKLFYIHGKYAGEVGQTLALALDKPKGGDGGLIQTNYNTPNNAEELAAKYSGLKFAKLGSAYFVITAPPGSTVASALNKAGFGPNGDDDNKWMFGSDMLAEVDQALAKAVIGASAPAPADKPDVLGGSGWPIKPDYAASSNKAHVAAMENLAALAVKVGNTDGLEGYDTEGLPNSLAIYQQDLIAAAKKKIAAAGGPPKKSGLVGLPFMPHTTDKDLIPKYLKVWHAGQTGDVAQVEAVKIPPDSKWPYVQKAYAFKMATIAALKSGAQPDPNAVPNLSMPPKKGKDGKPVPAKPAAKPLLGKPKPYVPPAPAPVGKVDPGKFPPDPVFTSSNAANVAANKMVAAELKALATAGKLEDLKALPIPPSQKLQDYKNELVSQVDEMLHPPPPPVPYDGALDHLTTVFAGPKDPAAAHAKKIGYYLITEEPGVPNNPKPWPAVIWKSNDMVGGGAYNYQLTNKATQKAHGDALKSMTPNAQDWVMQYTGGTHASINAALRQGVPSKDHVEMGREMVAKSPLLPPGLQFVRRMSFEGMPAIQAALLKSAGKILQEPAVTSTTLDPKKWHGETFIHFTAAEGARGLYIADQHTSEGGGGHHDNESEILLPPGTRYYITKVETMMKGSTKQVHLHAIMLPTVPEQCC